MNQVGNMYLCVSSEGVAFATFGSTNPAETPPKIVATLAKDSRRDTSAP